LRVENTRNGAHFKICVKITKMLKIMQFIDK
jgi:hypothetical protein